jgi:protein gp37
VGLTSIEWTSYSFNPWWGCERVSPACAHCYADRDATRYGFGTLWQGDHRFLSEANWAKPLRWNRLAEEGDPKRLVFCASMADVFEDHPDLRHLRDRLWGLIEATPALVWQLLTKRPENIERMLPWSSAPHNVWLGTSIENIRFTWRARVLARTPAPVHFLSCEPLLGSLFPWMRITDAVCRVCEADADLVEECAACYSTGMGRSPLSLDDIEWVIGGGESGPKHRETKPEWAVELRDRALAADIPFFWKQNGGLYGKQAGKELEGREWCEVPELPPVAGQLELV